MFLVAFFLFLVALKSKNVPHINGSEAKATCYAFGFAIEILLPITAAMLAEAGTLGS